MKTIIKQCWEKGIIAGESALSAPQASMDVEVIAYLEAWKSETEQKPTDAMVAAWLIGFSSVLARHFSLVDGFA